MLAELFPELTIEERLTAKIATGRIIDEYKKKGRLYKTIWGLDKKQMFDCTKETLRISEIEEEVNNADTTEIKELVEEAEKIFLDMCESDKYDGTIKAFWAEKIAGMYSIWASGESTNETVKELQKISVIYHLYAQIQHLSASHSIPTDDLILIMGVLVDHLSDTRIGGVTEARLLAENKKLRVKVFSVLQEAISIRRELLAKMGTTSLDLTNYIEFVFGEWCAIKTVVAEAIRAVENKIHIEQEETRENQEEPDNEENQTPEEPNNTDDEPPDFWSNWCVIS